jgi:glycosyltransferase involved in cell wall biosynthesis
MNLLFVDGFTSCDHRDPEASSDAIGYGRTSASALYDALGRVMHTRRLSLVGPDRNAWLASTLQKLHEVVVSDRPDVVMLFHAACPAASEVRRLLDDIGYRGLLVGYTHGSHWDPTDTFRAEWHPRLKWADLGNLMALDLVLLVSHHIESVLTQNVNAASTMATQELTGRLAVVGLPVDLAGLDLARQRLKQLDIRGPQLLFNHAFNTGKNPDQFLAALPEMLSSWADLRIHFTRNPPHGSKWEAALQEVTRQHPERILCHGGLSNSKYNELLWSCTHQVSTALHETLGIATLEAMAAGVCSLAPRRQVYPEVMAGIDEALYKSDTPLPEVVAPFVSSPELSRRIGNRQAKKVRLAYSPGAVAARILHRLETIC